MQPLWTQPQFQYRADKIADWIHDIAIDKKIGPGDDDFEVAFQARWQMSYDYWIQERDRHLTYFGCVVRENNRRCVDRSA